MRRDTTTVILSFLSKIKEDTNGNSLSTIGLKNGMSYQQVKLYEKYLVDNQFIEYFNDKYIITERGLEILTLGNKLFTLMYKKKMIKTEIFELTI